MSDVSRVTEIAEQEAARREFKRFLLMALTPTSQEPAERVRENFRPISDLMRGPRYAYREESDPEERWYRKIRSW